MVYDSKYYFVREVPLCDACANSFELVKMFACEYWKFIPIWFAEIKAENDVWMRGRQLRIL